MPPAHGKRSGQRPTPNRTGRQSQHSGTQDSSATQAMVEKMTKAKDLESDLEKLQQSHKSKRKVPPDAEAKSSAIRLELCSTFSDIILFDPQFASSHNIIERLWKHCFYGRINELRLRLSKEKSRAKKRSAGVGGASVASGTSTENMVEEVDKQLKLFIKEAVALYQYLIKKYTENLLSESSQATSAASQDSQNEYHDAAISSLYRMHIHLGDLHRYSSTYKQAEECYLTSVKLAPGLGNPFNQLAVVAQSQDSLTVVALYYYARSLMANTPFETSRPNLVRLFESNQKWLSEQSRNSDSHTRSRGLVIMPTNSGKKAQNDWINKEKTAMTRTTLSKMVDLQHAFFLGISLDEGDGKVDLNDLMEKMSSQLTDFNELLSNNNIGELLLCKIVSILAFSTLGASNAGKLSTADQLSLQQGESDSTPSLGVIMNNQAIAFSFLLRFVSLLAKHACSIMEKGGGGTVGNARSFASLLLGASFAASIYNKSKWFHALPLFPHNSSGVAHEDNGPIRKLCRESHFEFWGSVASIANKLRHFKAESYEALPGYDEIKEFSDFYCYIPFASFLNRALELDTKYASLGEAIAALSPAKSSSSKTREEEALAKVRLFLSLASQATRPEDSMDIDEAGPYLLKLDTATDTLKPLREEDITCGTVIQNNLGDQFNEEDESATKSQYSDLGIPLLTPAALLGNPPPLPEPETRVHIQNIMPNITIGQPSAQKPLPPPPGLAPPPGLPIPPGFNIPPAQTPTAGTDPTTLFPPQPESTWTLHSSTPGLRFAQGNSLGGLFPSSTNAGVMSQAGPSILDTLNPFAMALENSTTEPSSTGLDLNSLLNNSLQKNAQASTHVQPSQSMEYDQYNHHESLLNFLFEQNDQGNEDNQQQSSLNSIPRTNNPFIR